MHIDLMNSRAWSLCSLCTLNYGLIRLKNATSGQNSKLPVKYPPPWPKNFSKIPPGNLGHCRCLLQSDALFRQYGHVPRTNSMQCCARRRRQESPNSSFLIITFIYSYLLAWIYSKEFYHAIK